MHWPDKSRAEKKIRNVICQLAMSLRKASQGHLPCESSFIPFDILMLVALAHMKPEELSVKALFNSLPYSDMGIRYHLRQLVTDTWLEIHPSTSDKRRKLVIPSEKLLARLSVVEQAFFELIGHEALPQNFMNVIDHQIGAKPEPEIT